MSGTNDLSYPIGKFIHEKEISSQRRKELLNEITEAPFKLSKIVDGLTEEQLNTPYRPGGWTVKQVVHHLADSHLNAYVRTKLALTENEPVIKPYNQADWANLKDSFDTSVEVSLTLLDSVHKRWVTLLKSLNETDFKRKFRHPEIGLLDIDWIVAQYAWHGKHHTAHIASLKERMNWK
jgi:hypothetical protein